MSVTKSTVLCLLILAFVSTVSFVQVKAAQTQDITLSITVAPEKKTYNYREPIKLSGSFVQNGLPVSNGTVGVAVYDSYSLPIAFRTVKTGQTPQSYRLNFVELAPCNESGVAKSSFVPGEFLWLRFSVKNYDSVAHYQVTTITIFDANGVPLTTRFASPGTIAPGASPITFFNTFWTIPTSAQPGNTTIVGCVFSDYPNNGGVPYCEEKKAYFEIKRNPELVYSTPPMADLSAPDGSFASSLKITNELRPGDYQVYASARSTLTNGTQQSLLTVQNMTYFSVINARMPPQAAFTYYPVDSYVNLSITFDASASTAEGYNVTLVKYEWDFGDGSPKVAKTTPVTTHTYTVVNNYTVTLNVTDSQGLWSTTSKVIMILPPTGPQANFIWYPATPRKTQPVTFDATSTKLGWNGTGSPPIVNYIWDFGDGNVTSGNYLKIVHVYANEGNYTVKLNVTDASGFNGYIAKTVMVKVSGIPGDINGDGTVDIFDAILLAAAFNSNPSSPNWNPNADINGDNVVDIFDAITLAGNFNKSG